METTLAASPERKFMGINLCPFSYKQGDIAYVLKYSEHGRIINLPISREIQVQQIQGVYFLEAVRAAIRTGKLPISRATSYLNHVEEASLWLEYLEREAAHQGKTLDLTEDTPAPEDIERLREQAEVIVKNASRISPDRRKVIRDKLLQIKRGLSSIDRILSGFADSPEEDYVDTLRQEIGLFNLDPDKVRGYFVRGLYQRKDYETFIFAEEDFASPESIRLLTGVKPWSRDDFATLLRLKAEYKSRQTSERATALDVFSLVDPFIFSTSEFALADQLVGSKIERHNLIVAREKPKKADRIIDGLGLKILDLETELAKRVQARWQSLAA